MGCVLYLFKYVWFVTVSNFVSIILCLFRLGSSWPSSCPWLYCWPSSPTKSPQPPLKSPSCVRQTHSTTGFKFTFQRFSTWIQAKEMSFSTSQFTSRCIQTFTWQGCCKSGPMIWSRTMTFTYLLCNLFNFIEGWYFAPVLIRIKYFCTLNKVNNHRHLVI